jgi:1-acyl-sn-glycerol-3-phosphate acyltransferase
MFLDLHVFGREHIPPGPKIYAQNHITSTDPYWVLPLLPEPVHVIIGPGYQSKVMSRVLDYFEQINAMPHYRDTVVEHAVKYLERGESVYTAPEGDIQEPPQLGRFYPGVAKIYRRAQVPIIPIALAAPRSAMKEFPRLDIVVEDHLYRCVAVLRGPFCINVGEPFTPELAGGEEDDENQRIMDGLRDRIRLLVEDPRVSELTT